MQFQRATRSKVCAICHVLVVGAFVVTVNSARDSIAEGDQPPPLLKSPFDAAAAKSAQAEWARHLIRKVEDKNSIDLRLVLVPPGEYMMGSGEDPSAVLKHVEPFYPDARSAWFVVEHPRHRVRITRPFSIGASNVTVGQFRKFVEAKGYKTTAEKDGRGGWGHDPNNKQTAIEQKPQFNWHNWGFEQGDDHPVVNVSWYDANAFCNWLSEKEGKTYRLPTEAEFEYACRAGTTTRFHNGDDYGAVTSVANVNDSTAADKFDWMTDITTSDGYAFTAPIAKFKANAFGLYDMHGNAETWCSDRYADDYYSDSPVDDPPGAASGKDRVVRGGSWNHDATFCRSAHRGYDEPSYGMCYVGFRVVCDLESSKASK